MKREGGRWGEKKKKVILKFLPPPPPLKKLIYTPYCISSDEEGRESVVGKTGQYIK